MIFSSSCLFFKIKIFPIYFLFSSATKMQILNRKIGFRDIFYLQGVFFWLEAGTYFK